MKESHFPGITSMALAIALLGGCLIGAGCSNETTPTVPNTNADSDPLVLVTDPLDGSLNSMYGSTPDNAGIRIDRLADALGLDENQTAALAEAYAEFRSGLDALRALVRSGELTREQAQQEAALLRDALEAALQVILTPEQWNQLLEMRDAHHGTVHEHFDPVERWTAWLNEIGADEDQVAAALTALNILREGITNLREQFQAGTITREEALEQALILRETFDATLQEILTAEQYEALMELRPDSPGRRHLR